MKPIAFLFGATVLLAPILSAQSFLVDDGPEGFDSLIYFYAGSLEITGGAVYEDPAGDRVGTGGDVVSFDYKLSAGPGHWVDRIYDIEYRAVTYQLTDPARMADPWTLDPTETYLGEALSSEATTPAWFDVADGSVGGLQFTVRYGDSSFVFMDDSYLLNQDLGNAGFELDTSSTSFYEVVLTGLLAGETVILEVAPDPFFSGLGLASPYTFDFEQFNVAAALMIPEGALTVIPEPASAALFSVLGLGAVAMRRKVRPSRKARS